MGEEGGDMESRATRLYTYDVGQGGGGGLKLLIYAGDWHEQEYKTRWSKADSACKGQAFERVLGEYEIWKQYLDSYWWRMEPAKKPCSQHEGFHSLWCNWGTKGEVIIHWIHRKSLDPWWWLLAQPVQELHIFPNFSWWGVTTTMGTLGSHLCPILILSILTKSQVRTIPSIIGPYSFHRSIPSGHSLPACSKLSKCIFMWLKGFKHSDI